jgi:rubrerythrin
MRDVEQHTDEETQYECFTCGTIAVAESQPVSCPDCGGEMRNRRTPIE